MSYAPIYSKLTDLDTRLSILELSAKSAPVPTQAQAPVPVPVPDYANTVVAPYAPVSAPDSSAEISGIREEINNLLKECVVNTSAINLLSLDIASLATKEELTALATKGEEFALATKGELAVVATLATKDELAEVSTKFENILAVLSQLNTKIIEATDRITAIESSSSA